MKHLYFGTAGIPNRTKGDTIQGIKDVHNLGLGAFELEFVRGVHLKKDKTPDVKKTAADNNIILTCHSPYFINLNSYDNKKFHASVSYITSAAEITSLCGGYSVCFHAGYYQKQPPHKVYERIKKGMIKVLKKVKEHDTNIWIRPELTGKATQWGDLNEIVKISTELDQVLPCVDFAHHHARYAGANNTYDEFAHALEHIEKHLGKTGLHNMHIHIAGINYGDKGERNHLNLNDSDMNYKDLVKAWKDYNIKGVVICESPNIEKDALLLQKTYKEM